MTRLIAWLLLAAPGALLLYGGIRYGDGKRR